VALVARGGETMNNKQWAALKDFCIENCCTKYDVLKELKENGTIDQSDTLKRLGYYTNGNTYEDMRRFLEDNLPW